MEEEEEVCSMPVSTASRRSKGGDIPILTIPCWTGGRDRTRLGWSQAQPACPMHARMYYSLLLTQITLSNSLFNFLARRSHSVHTHTLSNARHGAKSLRTKTIRLQSFIRLLTTLFHVEEHAPGLGVPFRVCLSPAVVGPSHHMCPPACGITRTR